MLICVTCKLTTHEGHRTCGFEKAAHQEKQNLAKLLAEVKNRISEYGKILEDWRKYDSELDKHKLLLQVRNNGKCVTRNLNKSETVSLYKYSTYWYVLHIIISA